MRVIFVNTDPFSDFQQVKVYDDCGCCQDTSCTVGMIPNIVCGLDGDEIHIFGLSAFAEGVRDNILTYANTNFSNKNLKIEVNK